MILAKIGNSESYKKEAVEAIEKYDGEGMIGQVDQLSEIESKDLTIKAYESKLGRKLTADELKYYSFPQHFLLSSEEARNKILIEKCMSKIK